MPSAVSSRQQPMPGNGEVHLRPINYGTLEKTDGSLFVGRKTTSPDARTRLPLVGAQRLSNALPVADRQLAGTAPVKGGLCQWLATSWKARVRTRMARASRCRKAEIRKRGGRLYDFHSGGCSRAPVWVLERMGR